MIIKFDFKNEVEKNEFIESYNRHYDSLRSKVAKRLAVSVMYCVSSKKLLYKKIVEVLGDLPTVTNEPIDETTDKVTISFDIEVFEFKFTFQQKENIPNNYVLTKIE